MPSARVKSTGLALLVALAAATCGADGEESSPTTDRPNEGSSAAPAELPEPRTEVTGTVFDDEIVVVGGLVESGGASARADAWAGERNTWEPLPDLPIPLHHTAVVVFQGRVWVIGGYTTGVDAGWVASDRVFSLGRGDAGWDDQWRDEPSLATPRGALAAAVTPDRIVAGGGVDPGGTVLDSVEVFVAGSGGWSGGPSLRAAREHFAMAAVGSDVFAVAGRVGGLETNLASTERFRLDAGAWVDAGTLMHSRGGIGASAVGDRPCVAGGEEPAGTIAEVECRRTDGTWEVAGRLDTARHGLAVVSLGDGLHVVGGGPEPGLTVSGVHEVVPIPLEE